MQTSRQPQRKRPRVNFKMIKRKESKYIITPENPTKSLWKTARKKEEQKSHKSGRKQLTQLQ